MILFLRRASVVPLAREQERHKVERWPVTVRGVCMEPLQEKQHHFHAVVAEVTQGAHFDRAVGKSGQG